MRLKESQKGEPIMGLFGSKSSGSTDAPPENPFMKKAGVINMTKGGTVNMRKGRTITVTCSWTDRDKDYDLMAQVRYTDGRTEYVVAVNNENSRSSDGSVVHGGDVKGGHGIKTETMTINLRPGVASVALFAYSALENGAGSFREYGVSVLWDDGATQAGIQAVESSRDRHRYYLVFGEVVVLPDGTPQVRSLELYSKNHSESRPAYQGDRVVMDAGPEGSRKQ